MVAPVYRRQSSEQNSFAKAQRSVAHPKGVRTGAATRRSPAFNSRSTARELADDPRASLRPSTRRWTRIAAVGFLAAAIGAGLYMIGTVLNDRWTLAVAFAVIAIGVIAGGVGAAIGSATTNRE